MIAYRNRKGERDVFRAARLFQLPHRWHLSRLPVPHADRATRYDTKRLVCRSLRAEKYVRHIFTSF